MKTRDLNTADQMESAWQEANAAQAHLGESIEFVGHAVEGCPTDEVDIAVLAKILENLRAIQAEPIPAVSALRAL
jgi:hypothetical protein